MEMFPRPLAIFIGVGAIIGGGAAILLLVLPPKNQPAQPAQVPAAVAPLAH